MFNRDKLKALADQARAAGGRLATSAQAGIAQAQQNFAAQRAANPGSGIVSCVSGWKATMRLRMSLPVCYADPNATPYPKSPVHNADLAAEDAIRLLTAQNEALRMRLKAQKRLSEENEHLRAALEQLQVCSSFVCGQ